MVGRPAWTRDPDHRILRAEAAAPQSTQTRVLAFGEPFPYSIDGARSDGTGYVLADDAAMRASRTRAIAKLQRPGAIDAASRGEALTRLAGTARRDVLVSQLGAALDALGAAGVEHAVIGGSMVDAKPNPGDVDLLWLDRVGVDAVDVERAMARVAVPDVSLQRATGIVLNAPTIPGAVPGSNFLEFFSSSRGGFARSPLLVPTRVGDMSASSIVDAAASALRRVLT